MGNKGNEEQSGFTKRWSTVEHIYIISQILEKSDTQREYVSLIFYDMEKVDNSIPKKLLWKALGKTNVNQSVTRIIRRIYV
jgi:transcriptional regulator NrdR family protein